ncbi:MAG: leucine-rich repeat-containing protein kinase family protein [Pseudomonas sp.]
MHTLEQLRRGELAGISRLDLSCGLSVFPAEIFDLADSLEVLNLSGNQLSQLPADLPRLRKLKVIFCSDNPFTVVPEVLGDCPQLEMVGFKANRIAHVPAASLPAQLRWLILSDNQVAELPAELGARPRLQKLMLAGNRLAALPESLSACRNLQLLRIAANRFEHLPQWLLELPHLAWLAYAGNPVSDRAEPSQAMTAIPLQQIQMGEVLGEGASGIIHAAHWQAPGQPTRAMAAKLFRGEVTSDGLPHSEMAACLAAGNHPHLIGVAGPLASTPPGLLLERISADYQVLAGPPSLASCTRDCYPQQQRFHLDEALNIARAVASAVAHLHARGILHGDLYGHNLLVNPEGHCVLGDFGAASFFDPASAHGQLLQRIETRAFGCLLEELLQRCYGDERAAPLWQLQQACITETVAERPDFQAVCRAL